jgi:hypothetical protein
MNTTAQPRLSDDPKAAANCCRTRVPARDARTVPVHLPPTDHPPRIKSYGDSSPPGSVGNVRFMVYVKPHKSTLGHGLNRVAGCASRGRAHGALVSRPGRIATTTDAGRPAAQSAAHRSRIAAVWREDITLLSTRTHRTTLLRNSSCDPPHSVAMASRNKIPRPPLVQSEFSLYREASCTCLSSHYRHTGADARGPRSLL